MGTPTFITRSTSLEDVRRFIFSGQAAWTVRLDTEEEKAAFKETSVMHSTATWHGMTIERAVNKKRDAEYGRARYRVAPIGSTDWMEFEVATPAGVYIEDPAESPTARIEDPGEVAALRSTVSKLNDVIGKQDTSIAELRAEVRKLAKKVGE